MNCQTEIYLETQFNKKKKEKKTLIRNTVCLRLRDCLAASACLSLRLSSAAGSRSLLRGESRTKKEGMTQVVFLGGEVFKNFKTYLVLTSSQDVNFCALISSNLTVVQLSLSQV